MKIVYSAPNRAHHFKYAEILNNEIALAYFVSGFPRISNKNIVNIPKEKVVKADYIQTIYVLALKLKVPSFFTNWLAYWAKVELDFRTSRFLKNVDAVVLYNGAGLLSIKKAKKNNCISIIEVVNTHVLKQKEILENEYEKLKIKKPKFDSKDIKRRIKEYEEADYILTPSKFVKDSFIEFGFDSKKLLTCNYGIEINAGNNFNSNFKVNPIKKILFVGSISVRKGVHILINAFKKLDQTKFKLILIGPVQDNFIIDSIKNEKNITYLGVKKGEDLNAEYLNADIFCLPSIEDGFGLVVSEAISFNLPVIVSKNCGASEMVIDGVNGYVFDPFSETDLATKLNLISEIQISTKTSEKIKDTLNLKFDQKQNIKVLLENIELL